MVSPWDWALPDLTLNGTLGSHKHFYAWEGPPEVSFPASSLEQEWPQSQMRFYSWQERLDHMRERDMGFPKALYLL